MVSVVFIFFSIQLTISIVLYVGFTKSKKFNALESRQYTSILVPLKNEANRISPLLQSINRAAITYKKDNLFNHFEFIFIDDHSIDHSTQVILDQLDVSFKIIKLRETFGKKYAIKKGVELAEHDRILTLDADVNFEEQYLDKVSKIHCDALTILPVNMDSKSFLQRLFSVEFWFLQRLTFGLGGFNNYLLCNGANLLFTKKAFNKALTIRQDAEITSGDDMFLLKAITDLNLPITCRNQTELTVNTAPPQNAKALFNQRKRWIKKMKDLPSILGALFILVSNGFLIYSIYEIMNDNYLFFIPIGIKIGSEMISVSNLKKQFTTFIHQLFYPIYLIFILLSLPFPEGKWRG